MTTARDVIAKWWKANVNWSSVDPEVAAESLMSALLSAPESIRLELAALLNPWRPIETAPKDGKPVLVDWPLFKLRDDGNLTSEKAGSLVVVASQSPSGDWDDDSQSLNAMGDWFGDDCEPGHDPIHWLPLPAPPSELGPSVTTRTIAPPIAALIERLLNDNLLHGALNKEAAVAIHTLALENEALMAAAKALEPFAQWAGREHLSAMPMDGPVIWGGPTRRQLENAYSAIVALRAAGIQTEEE